MLINEVIMRLALDNFNLKGHGSDSVGRHPWILLICDQP